MSLRIEEMGSTGGTDDDGGGVGTGSELSGGAELDGSDSDELGKLEEGGGDALSLLLLLELSDVGGGVIELDSEVLVDVADDELSEEEDSLELLSFVEDSGGSLDDGGGAVGAVVGTETTCPTSLSSSMGERRKLPRRPTDRPEFDHDGEPWVAETERI
jgi:hypothetical protein